MPPRAAPPVRRICERGAVTSAASIAPSRSPRNRAHRASAASYSAGSIGRSKPSSATDATPFALVAFQTPSTTPAPLTRIGWNTPFRPGTTLGAWQRIADVAAFRVPEEVLVEGGEREAA